jgi:DNA-binding CsgD family transcriptional regulator
MGYKPETLAKYEAVAQLARSGKSVDEICEMLSLTRTMVYRGLHFAGIKLERDINHSFSLIKPLLGKGLSQAEISRRTGLSTTSVWRIINLVENGHPPSILQPYEPAPVIIPDLDPLWAAEFRGFFYGEGCATMDNEHNHLSPRLTINLRLDDAQILDDIHTRLGGSIYTRTKHYKGRNDHDQRRWTATGWPLCRAIIEKTGLASSCVLPAKKCRDLVLLYDAILARYSMPHFIRDDDRAKLLVYYNKLQEAKRYQL